MEKDAVHSISLCTFNMGSSTTDYLGLCRYQKVVPEFKSKQDEEAFQTKYGKVQQITADLLVKKEYDVYLLQEVGDHTRPLIVLLEKHRYRLIHLKAELFDAAIALHEDRFSDIENHSCEIPITQFFKKDVAIASAVHIKSKQRFVFLSAHVPGFNFALPEPQVVAEGDIFCKKGSELLETLTEKAIQIIGADMNGTPENAEERFEAFTSKGFEVFRSDRATNVNMNDEEEQERELDYFLVRQQKAKTFESFFSSLLGSKSTFKVKIDEESLLSWDPETNASDHLPITAKLELPVEK